MNHIDRAAGQRMVGRQPHRTLHLLFGLAVAALAASGCGNAAATPTRTPFPTWTATPIGGAPPVEQVAPTPEAPAVSGEATPVPPVQEQPPAEAPTVTIAPPTPAPTDTPAVVETPTPAPSDTPTATPEPSPTPTSAYSFVLETAEKFPTDSLAAGVVRIYLYVYSESELGLGGYSLQVTHNGAPLVVDEVSTAGAPDVTRSDPSPFTRFTNLNVIFVEAQVGRWEIQLIDAERRPVGPPAVFDLTADEVTRELYVRYLEQ